jgi:hypothetical protein
VELVEKKDFLAELCFDVIALPGVQSDIEVEEKNEIAQSKRNYA